jgi:hypothetical protein
VGIVAAYDNGGSLTDIAVSTEVTGTGEDISLEFSKTLSKPENGFIKAFLWKSDNGKMTPQPLSSSYSEGGDGIIHLLGDSVRYDGVDNVDVTGTTVTINAAGDYEIEGTLTDGQIVVNSSNKKDKITITLDGVNVTSSQGNAFDGQKGKVTLVPTENESIFTSTSTGDDSTAIFSQNDLTIKGDGTLRAVSNAGNGIRCKNDIEIGKCDLFVTAANNGIKGDQSVKITAQNRSVTVVSDGDGIQSDKAPSLDESVVYTEGGTITINGGNVNITAKTTEEDSVVSNGDGIKAKSLVEIKGGTITVNAAGEAIKATASSAEDSTPEDGDGCVKISGGTVNAESGEDGIKAVKSITVSGGSVTVDATEDGIQSDGSIDISGGEVDVESGEDGINAAGIITVSNGSITVVATEDAIQSDTLMNISGGTFDLKTNGGAPETISKSNSADYSCKGIKAANLIYITDGSFTINTYDDAVHTNNTARILGGTFNIATGDDGIHGDSYLYISDDADINITKCYEGIEAAKIYVNGGSTKISAYDDGVNAAGEEPTADALDMESDSSTSSIEIFAGGGNMGNMGNTGNTGNTGGFNNGPSQGNEDNAEYGYLEINGGYLYASVSQGDGLDANGDIVINGGVIIVDGATLDSEDGLDFNDGVEFNGGYVLTVTSGGQDGITGTYDQKYLLYGFDSSSQNNSQGGMGGMGGMGGSQNSSSSSTIAKGNYCIVDSSNNVLCAFAYTKGSFKRVTFSSPDVTDGTYYIKPLSVTSAVAENSLYGTVNDSYSFTLSEGCSVNTSGTSYPMSTY